MAIVGAGPYALSLAAHLRAAGVDHRVFGRPMAPWREGMPPGMLLKSHPWSSDICDPAGNYTLERYCAETRVDYHPSLWTLPLETFIDYGERFQKRYAPDASDKILIDLRTAPGGFRATFDDGESVEARRVVLAVGVHPFRHVAPVLADLPPHILSHSGDHGPLDALDGRKVAVVGSGASAIDLATLLGERGAEVTMVARAGALRFLPAPTDGQTFAQRVVRPNSGIGSGWFLWTCANAPWLLHTLPAGLRRYIVENTLGPLGGPGMDARLRASARVVLGGDIRRAEISGRRARLRIRARDGAEQTLEVDRVVAATGYRIDVDRLDFLAPDLRDSVRTVKGAPLLSKTYETSAPGLYAIGPAAAASFGPVMRFVFGASHPARVVASALAGRIAPHHAPRAGESPVVASGG
ncbi:MAG: FAD-dependent oxidoreductase [Caulobacteraceae bacterium]